MGSMATDACHSQYARCCCLGVSARKLLASIWMNAVLSTRSTRTFCLAASASELVGDCATHPATTHNKNTFIFANSFMVRLQLQLGKSYRNPRYRVRERPF